MLKVFKLTNKTCANTLVPMENMVVCIGSCTADCIALQFL